MGVPKDTACPDRGAPPPAPTRRPPITLHADMRRLAFALIGIGIVAIVVIGLTQSNGGGDAPQTTTISADQAREQLAGSPPPLAALHAEANQLLPGGQKAYDKRLRRLRGHPVVVNGWASWCGPCRAEFPYLQTTSVEMGKQVAFLGLNTEDNAGDARGFLEKFPVSYPSYTLPRLPTGEFGAVRGLPFMLFYDDTGQLQFLHQGGYRTEAQLREDIRRYALGQT